MAAHQHLVVQDVSTDPRYLTTFGSTRAEAVFVVASPADGHIIGTIDVESDRLNAFTPADEAFLGGCADALVPLWSSAPPNTTLEPTPTAPSAVAQKPWRDKSAVAQKLWRDK